MKQIYCLLFAALGLTLSACGPYRQDTQRIPYYTTEVTEGMAVIYLSPKGSDAAEGREDSPLATLGAALKKVKAGEATLIRLAPGVYRERVQITSSEANAAALIIEGARNDKGEWLSVIDGSEALDPSLWTARPEIGPRVYAYPKPDARLMLVNRRSVARIDQKGLSRRMGQDDTRPHTTREVLGWSEEHTVIYRKQELPFWEAIGGVYTPSDDGKELWMRLANEGDPSRFEVASAADGATMTLLKAKKVTLRNLEIRGGRHGVDVLGGEQNRLEYCLIPHGRRRVNITDGAIDTAVVGNRLEMGFYGHPTGAWGMSEFAPDDPTAQDAIRKGFIYNYFKYWASPFQVSDDVGIAVDGASGTFIQANLLNGGLIGIQLRGDATVVGNVIRRMSSVGTAVRGETRKAIYDGNLFSDCNINIRFQSLNDGEAREIYLLRNLSLLPKGKGTHIFCHYNGAGKATPDHKIAVYHNSFLGGARGLALPPAESPAEALRYFLIVNNRFIGCSVLVNAKRSVLGDPAMFGGMDYNQIAVEKLTLHIPVAWMGGHHLVESDDAGWSWDDLSYTPPALDNGKERGINLSRPYQLLGKERPALPGLLVNYFEGDRPDIGAPDADFSTVLSYDHQ